MSPSKILSLTIGPKSLFVVEVAGKGPALTRLAEFPFPADLSLSTPVELGQAFAPFFRQQKFSTRDLYIGLPARRLVTRRKDVPPASASVASSTLRLQAETEFSSATGGSGEADSFIVDFAGQTSSSDPTSVLLVATAQSCIDQCRQFAAAAGLRLRGITAASAALARATAALSPQPLAESLILSLTSGAAEIVVTHNSTPTQLRHLAVANAGTPESLPALAGEIRRTVASLHRNGSAGTPLTLALWDDSAQDPNLLSERIGMNITTPQLPALAAQADGLQSVSSPNAYASAVAVALAALSRPGLPVDFLHSRLAPPKESSKNRPAVIGITAAAIAVLLILLGVLDIYLKQRHLDNLQTQSASHSSEVKVAQTASDHLDAANRWIHRTPEFVPCLRDLTVLVPDVGDTIWATRLTVTADPKAPPDQLVGQSVDLQGVKDLTHKMLDSKQFHIKNVTYPGNRTNVGPAEITFSIEFNYTPAEHKK